jgi:ABC-type nitrate/sulfonate/bicarbonate transport system substrate-binding protein
MKAKWRVIAVVSAAALALAGCGSDSDSASSSGGSKDLFEFTMGSFNGEPYVLDYVAAKQGFFEKNGLKAKFISPSSGGATANTLFLGGTLKAWPGNPATIMQDMAKGEDIKIAGWRDNWIPFGIVVPGDGSLAKLKDASFDEKMKALKGKKIGLTAVGSLVYYSLLAGLNTAGLKESDVTILAVGQPDAGIAQMSAGRIDAYVTYSRTDVGVFNERIKAVQYASLTGEEAPAKIRDFSVWALPVLGSLQKEHPEVVSGYVKAQQEAYDWAKNNIDGAAQIVSDQVYKGQFKPIIVDALNKLFAAPQPYDFKVNPKTWDGMANLLVEGGSLKPTDLPSVAYDKVVLPAASAK